MLFFFLYDVELKAEDLSECWLSLTNLQDLSLPAHCAREPNVQYLTVCTSVKALYVYLYVYLYFYGSVYDVRFCVLCARNDLKTYISVPFFYFPFHLRICVHVVNNAIDILFLI